MSRSHSGTRFDHLSAALTPVVRRGQHRLRARRLLAVEFLEQRALLANITPSAVINSKPDGTDFDYTIKLTNSASSTSAIGTFWFAWVPGEDFLATSPISVTPPIGWSDQITHSGPSDGYAIQYTANSSSSYVPAGSSMNFMFKSADKPASVYGNSVFFPTTPVGTSFVYPQAPFSDAGHEFVAVPALISLAVTPTNPSLPKGETQQFTATGTFDGGTTQNVTSKVTWASATPGVATISNASGSQGVATAVAAGTSKISAALSGITATQVLTVTAPALLSLAVTPANPSLPKGETDQFTATGTFSDKSTQNLTSLVTWSSATPSVASINSGGLATAVAATGTSKISATLKGVIGSTVLTVAPAVLVSLAVTPANPSLPKGKTEQFIATGTFSDNSTKTLTTQVKWASATTLVATISTGGLATAAGTGTSKISATLAGVTGTTVLTATPAALVSIAVTPANPSLTKGATLQFTAIGTFSDNSTEDLTSLVTWASATNLVATISSGGLATGAGTGTSKISATLQGISGSTVLTVTAPAAATAAALQGTSGAMVLTVSASSATTTAAALQGTNGSSPLTAAAPGDTTTAAPLLHRRRAGHPRGVLQHQSKRHARRVSGSSVLSGTGHATAMAPRLRAPFKSGKDSPIASFLGSW
jgi:hypothetical protein